MKKTAAEKHYAEWLEKYGEKSSLWTHYPMYNMEMFDEPQPYFEKYVNIYGYGLRQDLWAIDYFLSLTKCMKAGFITRKVGEDIIEYLHTNNYTGYLFLDRNHVRELFKIMAQKMVLSEKIKTVASAYEKAWLRIYDEVRNVAKHSFLNPNTLFRSFQNAFTRPYYHKKELFHKNLWIVDYLISIDKMHKYMSQEEMDFLKNLLLSENEVDVMLGVTLLQEDRLSQVLNLVAERITQVP